MKDRQWRNLIKDIKNQRCILMLGAGLSTFQDEPLLEVFSKYLIKELEEESIPYEKDSIATLPYVAQRFMTIPDIRRIDLEDEAIAFFKEHTKVIPKIFKSLAKLPFHLIINAAPDNFMQQALLENGRKTVHALHYNFKKDRDEKVPLFSAEQVLIYNLYGSLKDAESLVFTEKEKGELIKNILQGTPAVPHKIVSEFDDRKTYLFLGCDIRDKRFHLLLESLQIKNSNSSYAPDFENYPLSKVTKSFYDDSYNFRFIEDQVAGFVEELVRRYEEENENKSTDTRPAKAKKVVLLYDDKDIVYKDELLKHLSELERNNYLDVWEKGHIDFGTDIEATFQEQLASAEFILCLMSADFLASNQFFELEIPKLMEQKKADLKVFPILIRAADLEEGEWNQFSILPTNRKPVNSEFWNSPDDAYQQIISELKTNILPNV